MLKQGFCVNEALRRERLLAWAAAAAAGAPAAGDANATHRHVLWPSSSDPRAGATYPPHDRWLFHLDADEALVPTLPGAPLHLGPVLSAVPAGATALRFANVEAVPPHRDVVSPLDEVAVFKAAASMVEPGVWAAHSPGLRTGAH